MRGEQRYAANKEDCGEGRAHKMDDCEISTRGIELILESRGGKTNR